MNVYYMFAQNNTCCSLLLQCCYVFFFLAATWFSTLVAPTLLLPESSRFGWPCHPPQFWTDTPNLRPWIEDSPQRNSSKLSALLLIGFVVVVRDWAHILPCCYILTKCSAVLLHTNTILCDAAGSDLFTVWFECFDLCTCCYWLFIVLLKGLNVYIVRLSTIRMGIFEPLWVSHRSIKVEMKLQRPF